MRDFFLILMGIALFCGCKQKMHVNILSENPVAIAKVDIFIENLNKKGIATDVSTYFENGAITIVLDTLCTQNYRIESIKVKGKNSIVLTANSVAAMALGLIEIEKQIVSKKSITP